VFVLGFRNTLNPSTAGDTVAMKIEARAIVYNVG
jgi:hypothetical protein